MTPGQHSHKHTHRVVDGNGHPTHDNMVHDHAHADGPTPDASRHHDHTEEPAVVAPGPITPGLWMLAAPDPGEPTTRDHPGDPGHPAYIYATLADHEVVIAHVMEPTYWSSESADRMDSPVEVDTGGWEANAKLMTFSPALLRFVLKLAAQQGGGVIPFRDEALALIKQLNELEVRSDADRW